MDFIAVLVGSGLAVAVVNICFKLYEVHVERRLSATYLALQLAFALEGYAIKCADLMADHKLDNDSGGHIGKPIESIPELTLGPFDENYKQFDHEILVDILDLPQRQRMAAGELTTWWDITGDVGEVSQIAYDNTVRLGISALNLATKIRSQYNLKSRHLRFGTFDIEEFLQTEFEAVEVRGDGAVTSSRSKE